MPKFIDRFGLAYLYEIIDANFHYIQEFSVVTFYRLMFNWWIRDLMVTCDARVDTAVIFFIFSDFSAVSLYVSLPAQNACILLTCPICMLLSTTMCADTLLEFRNHAYEIQSIVLLFPQKFSKTRLSYPLLWEGTVCPSLPLLWRELCAVVSFLCNLMPLSEIPVLTFHLPIFNSPLTGH